MKRRHSGSGRYISEEQAVQVPAENWTEEKDFDKNKFLSDVYKNIETKTYLDEGVGEVVRLDEIKDVLKKFGLKI